jgi:hypothetical protein
MQILVTCRFFAGASGGAYSLRELARAGYMLCFLQNPPLLSAYKCLASIHPLKNFTGQKVTK